MVSATITYRRAGLNPPVFVAGSFTEPEWVPQEMKSVLDDRGENTFVKEVEVEEGRDYQYKFKIGDGNDWDLDEKSPTRSDDMGNMNNLLIVPTAADSSSAKEPISAGDANFSPKITSSGLAQPVLSRSSWSNELEDNHAAATDSSFSARQSESERTPELMPSTELPRSKTTGEAEVDEVPKTPLFAHECLGAYDFEVVDDGFDHSLSPSVSRGLSMTSLGALAPEQAAEDAEDPTLEKFPSEKSSIMDTLRRISTGTGEPPVGLEDARQASRRPSVDSITDSIPSTGSLSPTSSRKRDSRLSHSSAGLNRSAISLGSIVEESPRESGTASSAIKASIHDDDSVGLTSDEEGPQLKGVKVSPTQRARESREAQASSVALSSTTLVNKASEMESSEPRDQTSWDKNRSGDPLDGKWYITGGMILLALGVTWWKSSRD